MGIVAVGDAAAAPGAAEAAAPGAAEALGSAALVLDKTFGIAT